MSFTIRETDEAVYHGSIRELYGTAVYVRKEYRHEGRYRLRVSRGCHQGKVLTNVRPESLTWHETDQLIARQDEIIPGLWQSGTPEDHTPIFDRFDIVFTMYAMAPKASSGNWIQPLVDRRFEFHDGYCTPTVKDKAIRAATEACAALDNGATVLMRCQAGINRSSLVTALVLINRGMEPKQAIDTIRSKRDERCLSNDSFKNWLLCL